MQFILFVYLFIGILFVAYLILGIKAFCKYLNEDTERDKNILKANGTKPRKKE